MNTLKEKNKTRKIEDLKIEYDKLQKKYGAKELDSIYNGGCENNPDICFVFMNPTGRNIASDKSWRGRKSPWLGTKNIWKLFNKVDLLSNDTYNKILEKKPKDWDYDFCDYVYDEIERNKVFITNLGKCTQIDARPLSDDVLKQYLDLLFEEIDIIKPKAIVAFGNQVSSNIFIAVLVLLPALICTGLVIPVANYHNILVAIQELIHFYSNNRNYKWRGWCAEYESKRDE